MNRGVSYETLIQNDPARDEIRLADFLPALRDSFRRLSPALLIAPLAFSRAGLLTGRYQNRFGYESNDSNKPRSAANSSGLGGMPVSEWTTGGFMKACSACLVPEIRGAGVTST